MSFKLSHFSDKSSTLYRRDLNTGQQDELLRLTEPEFFQCKAFLRRGPLRLPFQKQEDRSAGNPRNGRNGASVFCCGRLIKAGFQLPGSISFKAEERKYGVKSETLSGTKTMTVISVALSRRLKGMLIYFRVPLR